MNFSLKNVLITVSSIAGILALITFYVVFYGNSGTYVVNSAGSSNTVFSTSTVTLPSLTASSTLSLGSSTTSSTLGGGITPSSGEYASNYSVPPITWNEGNEQMYVTNATLNGSQLTLELQITMGNTPGCVPLNLKLIVDENGDTTSPVTPQFTFPDSGTCAGSPGETYTDQQVVFSIDPTALPVILTTGGSSNILFEIDTTPADGLTIQLPASAG